MNQPIAQHHARRAHLRAKARIGGLPAKASLDPAKIIARRKSLGLTQAQLAALIEVSQQAVARMESGLITDPRLSTVIRLAAALQLPVAAIAAFRLAPAKVKLVRDIYERSSHKPEKISGSPD